jgi:hypothetical protein
MKPKFSFTLKGVDIEKVNKLYNLSIVSNIDKQVENLGTKISDLKLSKDSETITFLDKTKRSKDCVVTMLNYVKNETLPETTNVCCFWCRHSFSSLPLGCPLRYVPSKIEKFYNSEITKEDYSLNENITNYTKNNLKKESNITDSYYEIDGIFCSFNCCLAFIQENKLNPAYSQSRNLLVKLYSEMTGKTDIIEPAPSWRLLKAYGGNLDISEFRRSFNKVTYIESYTLKPISLKMSSKTYEKIEKF